MEFRAIHRRAGITPRKTRYVIDLIRGKDVNKAFEILAFTQKRASGFVKKLLSSAVANASQVQGVNVNKLYVREARVDGGPVYPARFMPGPMGRALPMRRRTAHISVILAQRDGEVAGKKKLVNKAEPEAAAKASAAPEKAAKESKKAKSAAGKSEGSKKSAEVKKDPKEKGKV